jgi:putative DNA primase/helicase
MSSLQSECANFSDAIARDLGAHIQPIPDGVLHRFDDPDGKRHNKSCWYTLFVDAIPAGAYGNWRTGYQATWKADRRVDEAEIAKMRADIAAAKAEREAEKQADQTKAAHRAQTLWNTASPALLEHPYLQAKAIPALSLKCSGEALLVPLRDVEGRLCSLQFITPDGSKKFMPKGRISGCFCLTGAQVLPPTGKVYICEGFATAATIASTVKLPTVAAMNAGNLLPVAKAIHSRYPQLHLVIAADNDRHTPGNPGLTKGREAATAVGADLTYPTLCADCQCSDYNDAAKCQGEK